jgi:L-lactate dehydrogenase complex protein LldG
MTHGRAQLNEFRRRAEAVSAVVAQVPSVEAALDYAVELCAGREACSLLAPGCELPLSAGGEALCAEKQGRILAAPDLCDEHAARLADLCAERSIELVRDGLARRLGGVDLGLTMAGHGIAETGTIVMDCRSREVRLASMIAEVHVAVLPASRIVATAGDLREIIATDLASPPAWLAFVSGPSRTADIERVLALGVHGPLELHVVLLEDG